MLTTEAEVASIRKELEMVQRALKLQTKRCRNLVAEYTRRLQEKEQQYQSEKVLRDDQLAKVLRALLIFEARLKQEQKFISHQLSEKDYIIKKQSNDIKRLLSEHYCKNCKTYYTPSSNMESFDSSSEYVITDYQSSNFESLDSSSETYATISEKDYNTKDRTDSEMSKMDSDLNKNMFTKGKNKDSLGRRGKRIAHRKSIGTYFEVLKLRNDNVSPFSNEDNTSNDYDNLDSLPPESISDKITMVSERIENTFNKRTDLEINDNEGSSDQNDSSINISHSECNNTVISRNPVDSNIQNSNGEKKNNVNAKEERTFKSTKITETIPVFDGDNETNDNWYASASDQDDEEHRDIYRNNPVLECMNQILLQNINDSISSPPKTPNVERKSQKRVKFSDEEANNDNKQEQETKVTASHESQIENNYYETPIQKLPNFYETPQSIYSNDYEQILSKCSESFRDESPTKAENRQEKEVNQLSTKKFNVVKTIDFERPDSKTSHFYVDMDVKSENDEQENKPLRKSKILRTPPALPPKPANLLSRYKLQVSPNKTAKENSFSDAGLDSEPDYCSISELNLPTRKILKKINVVAEINTPPSTNDVSGETLSPKKPEKEIENNSNYDPVIVSDLVVPSLVVRKNLEKFNVQVAKQTNIKNSPRPKISDVDIPKLPQVSEIIIPDEVEPKQQEERISFDNYVKNNSQILKQKQIRHPIMMGSSVSALITGFNNQQLLSEINQNQEKPRSAKKMFASFENPQNVDKHSNNESHNDSTLSFDSFDLSQNFEEFKLDDCEIGDDISESPTNLPEEKPSQISLECFEIPNSNFKTNSNSSRVELVRATNDALGIPQLSSSSIEQLRRKLEQQRNKISSNNENIQDIQPATPTYEHFLECTGLSSKSILTPSRLLSNHKAMLKPKDVKLRSKAAKSNGIFEKNGKSTIKYWSEPYI